MRIPDTFFCRYGTGILFDFFFGKILTRLFFAILVFTVTGCAVRPGTTIPPQTTAQQVIEVLEKRANSVRDFTGSALVVIKQSGERSKSIRLSIRHIGPERYRIIAKAFGGIPVAVVTADSDSLTVFFPSDNTYVTAGRYDDTVRYLISGIGFDIDRLTGVLTGFLPPSEELESYRRALVNQKKQAVLVLDNGVSKYSLTVEEQDFRVVGAEIERYGEAVMKMHASRFSDTGGIPFPGRVVMENERGVFDIEFSDCSINTGLKESDVLFTIPPGAERLSIVDVIRAL